MPEEQHSQDQLSDDIHLLGDILGKVIEQQAGIAIFDLEERIRALTKKRRQEGDEPDAHIDDYLAELIGGLDLTEAEAIARAFTTYFELINLAEENQRVRSLRARERAAHPRPYRESIAEAVEKLWYDGVSKEDMAAILDNLAIEMVFTAHPTEAKRRTVLSKLRRIADALYEREVRDLLPAEGEDLREQLLAEVTTLWLTDRSRTAKPLVTDEVRLGLHYFETTIWEVLPQIYAAMAKALKRYYPDLKVPPDFLTFGSWIGGDRDGNPNVTPEVTAESLRLHRGLAVETHRAVAQQLDRSLSLSTRLAPITPELAAALDKDHDSEHVAYLFQRYPHEAYRLRAAILRADLAEASKGDMVARLVGRPAGPLPRLRTQQQLVEPLQLMADSLEQAGAAAAAATVLTPFLRQAEIFGLHTGRLDLRQDSAVHNEVLTELCRKLGYHDDYLSLNSGARTALLTDLLAAPLPDLDQIGELSAQTAEAMELFRVVRRAIDIYGPEILGPYIISMTHGVDDMLAALLLTRWGGICQVPGQDKEGIAIAPLFETRADLATASVTMKTLFEHPIYARHLAAHGNKQVVMIGYSDSNKDAGYLAANWELFLAQEELAGVCRAHGVKMTLFHGRGGTIARGGGRTNRAIMAQPAGSVGGRFRTTEQGEIINERYGHPTIARRHLEQVVHAVLLASSPNYERGHEPQPGWRAIMAELAESSYHAYRDLIYETPELMTYWQAATPIWEINQLRIGSRPARRQNRDAFASLRAIPWGFSWMQSRHVLPGWYGVGTALATFSSQTGGLDQLKAMYREWPFFRVVVDNAQLSLGKADMGIARMYATLVEDEGVREMIYGRVLDAFRETRQQVLQVTGQLEVLDNETTLQRSIRRRNPYVDPLNFVQVSLLRQLRALPDPDGPAAQPLLNAVFLTINGIAAGLKNTG